MSFKVSDLVLYNYRKPGSGKLVMMILANWCDDRGLNLYPSIAAVADLACLSEVQTRRVIHGLIDDGYLEVVGNHDGGAKHATRRYRIVIERLVNREDKVIHTGIVDDTPLMDDTPITGERGRQSKPMKNKDSEKSELSTRLSPMRANTLRNNNKKHTHKSPIPDDDLEIGDVRLPAYVDKETVQDFKRVLKKKRGTLTNALLNSMMKEAGKAGITLEQAIEFCCLHHWATFKATWYWERKAQDDVLPAWVFSAKGHEEMAHKLHVNRVSTETDPVFFKRVRIAAGINEDLYQASRQQGA
ncbi:hypothetical protein ACKF11_08940 [Methylobacillus sp. Pita2]|uniref:hypothetical protein n=1 Tax=Methylobacillus sp. Pita2 TaxID=3383245 RepID=UPI0038B5EF58